MYKLRMFLLLMVCSTAANLYAQAPDISYTPATVTYRLNTAIMPLQPFNKGGAVPATVYGTSVVLAGMGIGYNDGTLAVSRFNNPEGAAFDANGNLYIADVGNNVIRKITPAGVVSTFAGAGVKAFTNGNGATASFNRPVALAFDATGNCYVADQLNNAIRKITPTGVVSTLAGNGTAGLQNGPVSSALFDSPQGIAIDAAGNIYVSEYGNNDIRQITPAGIVSTYVGNSQLGATDGDLATATFYRPGALGFDKAGNLYVLEDLASTVRIISTAGMVSTLIINSASEYITSPRGIIQSPSGDIFITSFEANQLYLLTSPGKAFIINFDIRNPRGLASDGKGSLYVSTETGVTKVTVTGYIIDKTLPEGLNFDSATGTISGIPTEKSPMTTYTVTGYNTSGHSSTVINIKVDDAAAAAPNISYASPQNYQLNTTITPLLPTNTGGVVPATTYGTVSTLAGSTGGYTDGLGTTAKFSHPGGIATDNDGNVYVADRGNNVIRKINPAGFVTTFAGTYNVNGAIDATGTAARFDGLSGITFDGTNLYVAESQNEKIRKIDLNGNVSTYIGKPNLASATGSNNGDPQTATFQYPWGIAMSSTGNLYIGDYSNHMIRKYASGGQVSTFAGATTSGYVDATGTSARFYNPISVAVDAAENVYVTDYLNNRIRKISKTGVVSTLAGNGTANDVDGTGTSAAIRYPYYVTIDATGNLYVSGQGNYIRRISPDGVVTTVAGNGAVGSANGAPKQASFNVPAGLAIDASGNLYVADEGSSLIRKVTITGYVIDKALPAGLTFDGTTGKISGTPTAKSPATVYTITAFNAYGSSSTTITIKVDDAVTPPATPTVLAPVITYRSPVTYYPGYKITDLKPANTGGAVPAIAYGKTSTINVPGYTVTRGIAADGNGNIYFTDYNKYQIIKVAADGTLSVFAGDANASPETKDGTGTAAHFYFPLYLATDALGNIYETESNLVRRINIGTVLVSTLTGTAATGNTNGTLANARFNGPQGLDVDAAGNTIYIADGQNNQVRKVDLLAGTVSTLNASGESLQTPVGVAYDAVTGNVYVSQLNGIIKKITAAGVVSTFAGSTTNGRSDGQGTAASFSGNLGAMAVDQLGNLYVSDAGNNLVRKITAAGLVSTLAGSTQGKTDGIGAQAQFYNPYGITSDKNGFVYITDNNNVLIRKISTYGYTIDKALPAGLTFDPTTGIISGIPTSATPAADYTVTAFNGGGTSSFTIRITVAPVPLPVQVNRPVIGYETPKTYYKDVTIPDLVPTNTGGDVPKTLYGDVSTIIDPANNTGSTFNTPVSVAVDNNNVIYVADNGASQVKKIVRNTTATPNTYTITTLSFVFNRPTAVAADAVGNVYIADQNGTVIRRIDADGNIAVYAGTSTAGYLDGPSLSAKFGMVSGMVTDIAGNLYVADMSNNCIRLVTQAGLVSTIAGQQTAGYKNAAGLSAQFNKPTNISIGADGNLYVSDYGNNRVRMIKLLPQADVSLYVGSGAGTADGQFALASFNGLYGAAIDPTKNVYIADEGNFTQRRAGDNTQTVSVIAGNNGVAGTDNGVYTAARFTQPGTVVLDHLGNLIMTDKDRIRNTIVTGYTISGGNLPTGLTFDPKTGIISGKPTVLWDPKDYTITAYNAGGSSTEAVVNIRVLLLSLDMNLPVKTVCDADFDPGAASTFGPVTYSSANTSVATIVNGKIHIVAAGRADITASDGINTSTKTLTVTAATTPAITINTTTTRACTGMPVTFTATVQNAGTGPTYQWQINQVNVPGETGSTFTTSTLKTTDKVRCVLSNVNGCTTLTTTTSAERSVPIDVYVAATVTISTTDNNVYAGATIHFTASALGALVGSTYQWLVNNKVVGTNSMYFSSDALHNGDKVNCVVTPGVTCNTPGTSNTIIVVLKSPGNIQPVNTFTPNGDGINDTWKIPEMVDFPKCLVSVYNRNGTLIYQSRGYSSPWDGTSKGGKVPTGTYYYVIDLVTYDVRISGSVTIIR